MARLAVCVRFYLPSLKAVDRRWWIQLTTFCGQFHYQLVHDVNANMHTGCACPDGFHDAPHLLYECPLLTDERALWMAEYERVSGRRFEPTETVLSRCIFGAYHKSAELRQLEFELIIATVVFLRKAVTKTWTVIDTEETTEMATTSSQ